MNNNIDMNKLMGMLAKMDKTELENGLNQFSKMMNVKDKDELMKKLNNMNK